MFCILAEFIINFHIIFFDGPILTVGPGDSQEVGGHPCIPKKMLKCYQGYVTKPGSKCKNIELQ